MSIEAGSYRTLTHIDVTPEYYKWFKEQMEASVIDDYITSEDFSVQLVPYKLSAFGVTFKDKDELLDVCKRAAAWDALIKSLENNGYKVVKDGEGN